MKIFPPPFDVSLDEGFSPERDLFGRAPIAEGLTRLVAQIDQPMVLAIDGAWGSGKTTFLRFWTGELRKASFPVVFFDAFQNDYADDAFIALAGEVYAVVQANKKDASSQAKRFASKAIDAGKVRLRSSLKVGVKAATMGALSSKDFDELAGAISDESADVFDATIGELITQQSAHRDAIEEFKRSLAELPSLLSPPEADGEQKPLIFIIDELDRCKPAFALELLERAKHFFSAPNVHFVLGVNTTQLCSSVRAVYGTDIDARLYLQKFIHLTWSLSQRERYASDRSRTKYFDYLIADLGFQGKDRETASNSGAFASAIAENKDLSFRTIERVVALIALAVATTPDTRLRVGTLIGGLALVKVLEPSLFSKAKADKMTWADAKTFFGFEDLRDDHSQNWEWIENWWRFVTDRDAPADLIERMERGLVSYSITDRFNLLSYTADTVMDNISLR